MKDCTNYYLIIEVFHVKNVSFVMNIILEKNEDKKLIIEDHYLMNGEHPTSTSGSNWCTSRAASSCDM